MEKRHSTGLKRQRQIGAVPLGDHQYRFRVWAPLAKKVELHLQSTDHRFVTMEPRPHGYYETVLHDVPPGALYSYRIDDRKDLPDPASTSQPSGVHGPSQVSCVLNGNGKSNWHGIPIE